MLPSDWPPNRSAWLLYGPLKWRPSMIREKGDRVGLQVSSGSVESTSSGRYLEPGNSFEFFVPILCQHSATARSTQGTAGIDFLRKVR